MKMSSFDPGGSEDDFLATIRNRLPTGQQAVVKQLEQVKNVYVPLNRDKLLAQSLKQFVSNLLSQRNGRRDDGRLFFITGESGAGKTAATERALANEPALAELRTSTGVFRPLVSLSLSGGAVSLKTVGWQLARAAGYAFSDRSGKSDVWDRLPEVLRLRRVLVVHLDETQHLLSERKSDHERKELAKALKGLLNYPAWPISFVLSGVPATLEIAKLDEQFERRQRMFSFTDIPMPSGKRLIDKLISEMCKPIGLNLGTLLDSDVPARLAHSANYRYGRMAQVILTAIEVALHQGDNTLSRDHFALAYIEVSPTRGRDFANPFIIDDWEKLEPGFFPIRDGNRT